MIVIGKGKKEEEKGDSYRELEEFSKKILELGGKIEQKLADKQELEQEIYKKEKKLRRLQSRVFSLKEKLVRVKTELSELEKRRREAKEEEEL